VSPAVFFLRKPDWVPPPPPPPRAPAAPTTPPLPRQNESAPLFLSPDSPFCLPISSPPVTPRPPASGRPPPYKSHPRAPSPHHGPGPRIDSLHPRPCCPPIKFHRHRTLLTAINLSSPSSWPVKPSVRLPITPSRFSPSRGELPCRSTAARAHSGESAARLGHRFTVDR
jgi:hypothetical protein